MKKLHPLLLTVLLLGFSTCAPAQSAAIRVDQHGTGLPMIMLPGFATPASVWNETIQHLPDQYEYHQVSYAGFRGVAPVDPPWYEQVKRDLLAYVVQHQLENLTLIGHSMGGNLATEIAIQMPERVRQLVIVDAIPCMRALMMPGVPAEYVRYDSPQVVRMLNLSEDSMRYVATQTAQRMTADPTKVDTLTRWMTQADRETYVYGYTDLLKMDLRPVLGKVRAETLILGAPFPDSAEVSKNYREQYANLKDKTIRIAPGGRHFIMFDQPEWLRDQLTAFLSEQ